MKPVLINKRKYTFKDIFRFIGIIAAHIVGFYSFIIAMVAIHYFVVQPGSFELVRNNNWFIIYWLTLAPILNGLSHIYYAETGNLSVRFFVWMHTLIFIISIVCIVWFF